MGRRDRMGVVLAGHVDHGKSTVLGRLLADTDSLPDGHLERVTATCERLGQRFEHAFLIDALRDERAQGITIDAARIFFRSARREYLLIDAPGHVEFIRNMVTGASRASAALFIVDVAEGVQESSRRHAYLLSLLGIARVVVVANKMDLIGNDERAFLACARSVESMLAERGIAPECVIPASARHGDNVAHRSPRMPWYAGPTVLEALDGLPDDLPPQRGAFRMPVQGVYRFPAAGHARRIVAGSIASGCVSVGDEIELLPSGKRSVVTTIESYPDQRQTAHAGEAVGFTLRDDIYARRGELLVRRDEQAPAVATQLRVSLFWLGRTPLQAGHEYIMKLGTARTTFRVARIDRVVDTADPSVTGVDGSTSLSYNQAAECVLELNRPIACDPVEYLHETGRFVIVDEHQIRGGGIVREVMAEARPRELPAAYRLPSSEASPSTLPAAGAVLWLSGLSASGKSTIARWVVTELRARGYRVEHLDGDTVRDIFPETGFDRAARDAHVRRVGHLASRLEFHGVIVVASFISPYGSSRDFVRGLCERFVEIHVATPLEECERRDVKGLYARARRGEISQFTGIDAPYESPASPDLRLDTTAMSIDDAGTSVLDCLLNVIDG